MDREAKSLEEVKFGEIADRPKDRKTMRCRWVYALKEDEKGKVAWYKSRAVLRGDLAALVKKRKTYHILHSKQS